jgi:hypothetical protein
MLMQHEKPGHSTTVFPTKNIVFCLLIIFLFLTLRNSLQAAETNSAKTSSYIFEQTQFSRYVWTQLNLGTFAILRSEEDPTSRLGVKPASEGENGVFDSLTLGTTPVSFGPLEIYGYYQYQQHWFSNAERFARMIDQPLDFDAHPFRADLMDRRQQLTLSIAYQASAYASSGILLAQHKTRMGSDLIFDSEQGYGSFNSHGGDLFLPWIMGHWMNTQSTQLYMLFAKDIDQYSPNSSYQSYYSLSDASVGLKHHAIFPDWQLNLTMDFMRYRFIFNDPWLDHERRGAFLTLAYDFNPQLQVETQFAVYNDSYQLPRLKLRKSSDSDFTLTPTPLARREQHYFLQLKLQWEVRPWQEFSCRK